MQAQVDESIAVQVMVVKPESQEIRANVDVTVKLQLRHNAEDGEVLTEQTFPVKTDNMGVCTLMFNVADKINWGDGAYYIATFIDGEETSVSKLSAVPFAIGSKKAETAQVAKQLSDVITPTELIGTWVDINGPKDEYDKMRSCIFNEDGTAIIEDIYRDDTSTLNGKWVLSSNGSLLVDGIQYTAIDDPFHEIKCTATLYHDGILYINFSGRTYALKKKSK